MEYNLFVMNTFQRMIGASLLIVSLSIAYYFIIFLPGKEKLQLQIEQQKIESVIRIKQQEIETVTKKEQENNKIKLENKLYLDLCLKNASESFTNNWNTGCEKNGLGKQCELPTVWADTYTENLNSQKEDCFKKYPQ